VVNKGSICRENARSLLKGPLRFEHGMRLVEASAWQVCSANYFALLGLRGKAIRTRKKYCN
jgi:hypothetical protein